MALYNKKKTETAFTVRRALIEDSLSFSQFLILKV